MKAKEYLISGGHAALLINPKFRAMTQQDRLLRVAMMAYAKHHLESPHIGWDKLADSLQAEICNTIGDDAFIRWGEKIITQNNEPDL